MEQGKSTLVADRRNDLHMLEPMDPAEGNTADGKKKISLADARRMFAHINVESLKKMIEREGHEVINDSKGCNTCILGKMPRPPSSIPNRISWISFDLCAVSTPSYGHHNSEF